MTAAVLKVDGLVKRYGERTALAGVSVQAGPGTLCVLLGPSGAGKSTLFQVLTGLFAADAGVIEIAGHSMARSPAAALAHIGVVFQQMSLDLDLSVERNLRFHAALHGLPATLARQRISEGAARAGIAADLQRPVRELSGGTRRRVELVRALLHGPALLLLDEPTVGLDPKSRRELFAAIRADVAERNTTVLWATHLVDEAEGADRVLVLHQGRLLADGAPAEVAARLGRTTLEDAFLKATARPSHPEAEGAVA